MFAGVLQTFARDMAAVPSTLQALLDNGEVPEATRVLHTLKGLAATVGARHLSQVTAALERQLKQTPTETNAIALVQDLQAAVDATAHALVPVLQKTTPALASAQPARSADADIALHAELQALCEMLEDSNMSAMELYARVRQAHGPGLGDNFEALDKAIAELQFEPAAALCRALMQQLQNVS